MTASRHMVGMAEISVAKGPALYTCLGLGSCIGLALYDPSADVSGMVHIMLPEKFPNRPIDKPGKFADTGIPELLALMERYGANTRGLKAAYAGGAQVFKFGQGATDTKLEVGLRNASAVQELMSKLGIRPLATDVGGSVGRTVTFCTISGEFKVRTVNAGEKLLCKLR